MIELTQATNGAKILIDPNRWLISEPQTLINPADPLQTKKVRVTIMSLAHPSIVMEVNESWNQIKGLIKWGSDDREGI